MAPTIWAKIKRMLRRGRRPSSPASTPSQKMPLAPIGRIPPEILSIIFLHHLPPIGVKNPERPAMELSQVCRLWRAVTFSLPALWASLNITCNCDVLYPKLDNIHAQLQRSANHPLSIILDTRNLFIVTPPHPRFLAVLKALVAARNRWYFISFTLVYEATQQALEMITQGDAPLLRSFHCEYPISSSPLHALQGCPQLESLTWSSISTPLSPILIQEAWVQLTELDLDAILTTSHCLALLQLSPRLSVARFREINSLGATPSRHVLHSTLQTLDAAGISIATLIDALTLPELIILKLDAILPDTPHTALHAFMVRSAPPLRILALENLVTHEPELIRALALVEDLEILSVCEPLPGSVTMVLIRALHPSPPPGPHPLCPRLTILGLGHLNAPDGVCAAMLRARWGIEARDNGVTELRIVDIGLGNDEHELDRAVMQTMIAEGLHCIF